MRITDTLPGHDHHCPEGVFVSKDQISVTETFPPEDSIYRVFEKGIAERKRIRKVLLDLRDAIVNFVETGGVSVIRNAGGRKSASGFQDDDWIVKVRSDNRRCLQMGH